MELEGDKLYQLILLKDTRKLNYRSLSCFISSVNVLLQEDSAPPMEYRLNKNRGEHSWCFPHTLDCIHYIGWLSSKTDKIAYCSPRASSYFYNWHFSSVAFQNRLSITNQVFDLALWTGKIVILVSFITCSVFCSLLATSESFIIKLVE